MMLSWLWQGLRHTTSSTTGVLLPWTTTKHDAEKDKCTASTTNTTELLLLSCEPELGNWVRGEDAGTSCTTRTKQPEPKQQQPQQHTVHPSTKIGVIAAPTTKRVVASSKVKPTTIPLARVTTRSRSSAAKNSMQLVERSMRRRGSTSRRTCTTTTTRSGSATAAARSKAHHSSQRHNICTPRSSSQATPKTRCCVTPKHFQPKRIVSTASTTSKSTVATTDDDNDNESNTPHPRQSASSTRKRTIPPGQPLPARRRRRRGVEGAIDELANHIVQSRKVVFITGAGLSVASGIRPFRSHPQAEQLPLGTHNSSSHVLQAGLWNEVLWSSATRAHFRNNPAQFYNEFWIPHFLSETQHQPNAGHDALQQLMDTYPDTVQQVTQNIDGLQPPRERQLVEVHGRVGLYKCCPDEDSDSEDDDDDDDENRPVQLGSRRKSRRMMRDASAEVCPYQFLESLTPEQLILRDGDPGLRARGTVTRPPCCPACGNHVMPQSLLFDEGYHSHSFYQFDKVEDWLGQAEVLVFVGTSLGAVRLTRVALEHARQQQLPCFNFNVYDTLESTSWLNASNIVGDATETLPLLVEACHQLRNSTVL